MYRGVTKLGAEKAPDGRDRVMVTWQIEPEFIGANCAERARVGDYELVVFDLPADRAGPAVIGWELFGPPRH